MNSLSVSELEIQNATFGTTDVETQRKYLERIDIPRFTHRIAIILLACLCFYMLRSRSKQFMNMISRTKLVDCIKFLFSSLFSHSFRLIYKYVRATRLPLPFRLSKNNDT